VINRSKLLVMQPRDRLHTVLVTRTWELGEFLDDIATVEFIQQDTIDTRSRSASHVWRAKANVPPLLAPHVNIEHFKWTATVQWSDDNYESRWRIEPHALRQTLSCDGIVTLSEAVGGRATQVAIDTNIDGLNDQQGIETIAYRIVLVNWQKLVEAAVRRLANE